MPGRVWTSRPGPALSRPCWERVARSSAPPPSVGGAFTGRGARRRDCSLVGTRRYGRGTPPVALGDGARPDRATRTPGLVAPVATRAGTRPHLRAVPAPDPVRRPRP